MEGISITRAEDRLARVLHTVRMRGTFYCQARLGEPWGLTMPSISDSLSFHIVSSGRFRLRLPSGIDQELATGDVALVPHGRGHVLSSDGSTVPAPRVDLLSQEYLTESFSLLEHGGSGAVTHLICGVVTFDEPAARELVRALPDVVVLGAQEQSAASSIRDTVRLMASELEHRRPGGEAVASRLADILVVQAIRAWLATQHGDGVGWLRALQDERIGRVLVAIHHQPGASWTLERLADLATMSRSTFSSRFTALVGQSPIAYLTRWRMLLAHDRLREDRAATSQIAGDLGYGSEASFHRAFTRVHGRTPGEVRRGGA